MGLPGSMVDEPMIELISDELNRSALSRSAGIGSGGGGAGLGRVISQIPTPPTARTSTTVMAATMGQGLRLGFGGWFHGVGPRGCWGGGVPGGAGPQLGLLAW